MKVVRAKTDILEVLKPFLKVSEVFGGDAGSCTSSYLIIRFTTLMRMLKQTLRLHLIQQHKKTTYPPKGHALFLVEMPGIEPGSRDEKR